MGFIRLYTNSHMNFVTTDMPREYPAYTELDDALRSADANMGAAEAHGVLCGMSCVRGQVKLADWLGQVFDEPDMNIQAIREASQLLVRVFESTRNQLNDPEAGFELLLLEDTVALSRRAEAMALWCQGFVFGMAVAGLREDAELPADTAEIIQDITEISRLGHSPDRAGDDADEDAFMQLYEYLRMGVLLISEELQPRPPVSETRH